MSYKKMELTKDFTRVHTRISTLQAIKEDLDFGRGLSLSKYKALAGLLRLRVDAYNTMLDSIDAQRKLCLQTTRLLRKMSAQIMLGVESWYGRDSIEYEKMGGKKRSGGRKPKGKKDS